MPAHNPFAPAPAFTSLANPLVALEIPPIQSPRLLHSPILSVDP